MYIDVLSLLEIKKIVADTVIIEHIRKNVSHINAMTINVGKKLTISMVEKSCSFIKKLALIYKKISTHVLQRRTKCNVMYDLINTPNTFKTMYCSCETITYETCFISNKKTLKMMIQQLHNLLLFKY